MRARKWGRDDVLRHIGMTNQRQNKLCKEHGIKLVKEGAKFVFVNTKEYLKLINAAGYFPVVIEDSKGVKQTLYVHRNRIFQEDHLDERVWFRATNKRS